MVFDVGRVLTEPIELAGYRLPAGVMVAPGIGLVHASGEVYPDPDRFDPDRMLGVTLGPTTWLPFGGGRCAGMPLRGRGYWAVGSSAGSVVARGPRPFGAI